MFNDWRKSSRYLTHNSKDTTSPWVNQAGVGAEAPRPQMRGNAMRFQPSHAPYTPTPPPIKEAYTLAQIISGMLFAEQNNTMDEWITFAGSMIQSAKLVCTDLTSDFQLLVQALEGPYRANRFAALATVGLFTAWLPGFHSYLTHNHNAYPYIYAQLNSGNSFSHPEVIGILMREYFEPQLRFGIELDNITLATAFTQLFAVGEQRVLYKESLSQDVCSYVNSTIRNVTDIPGLQFVRVATNTEGGSQLVAVDSRETGVNGLATPLDHHSFRR
ncbi:MAG: hypothetical protein CMF50_06165 [Legionellales bacterium]|nr:hypothetical protein [Legionellales bacterium]|tara:strand:+ start:5263 stop:6081 length:819 start_codon:yes stop_codon:yes gene_type:complete